MNLTATEGATKQMAKQSIDRSLRVFSPALCVSLGPVLAKWDSIRGDVAEEIYQGLVNDNVLTEEPGSD